MNTLDKLHFYFKIHKNVLLEGPHGVGKTSLVREVFENNGLIIGQNALIFSAATMDPWTDLIGIPYPVKGENDTEVRYLKPSHIDENHVEAIFFDEYNRSHKKIRNAVMELIQFKSINGRKFPNLKVVWAAINPDDHEVHTYDVEPLDPAQKDRFHVHIKMNNDLCRDFFIKKFGVAWTESAFDWWNNLPEKTKDNISPRRLEYALDIYTEDGDISDVLPEACLPKKLTQALSHGSPKQKFLKILESEDTKLLENFLNDFSNINSVMTIMESEERIALKCLKYIPKEALVNIISRSYKFRKIIENQLQNLVDKSSNLTLDEEKLNEPITEEQKIVLRIVCDMAQVDGDKTLSGWAKQVRRSIIPGVSILDEEELSAKDAIIAVKDRYSFSKENYEYINEHSSVKYDVNDVKKFNHMKNVIKNGTTVDRAHSIEELAANKKSKNTDWKPYLDMTEEYIKRSQKKTIQSTTNKKNLDNVVSWALKQMFFDSHLYGIDNSEESRKDKLIRILITDYPQTFLKFIAPMIEESKKYSIFQLSAKALIYAS